MRILYFSRDYTTHDRRFLAKIAGSTREVFYLRLQNDGVKYEPRPLPPGVCKVEWAGGRARLETPDQFLRLLPDLQSVLHEVQPDLVHAGPILSSALLTALLGFRPLLAASWGTDILVEVDHGGWNRWAARFTLERIDGFLCDCQPVKDRAHSIFPIPDGRVVMFPWGIELSLYQPNAAYRAAWRAARGWNDCFVVIATRAWHFGYGIEMVVRAFAEAHRRNPALRLLLLGTGEAKQAILGSIETLGVGDLVYLPGQVCEEKVVRFLQVGDIYFCCTPSDGTSISLLEAMAMRLPAVVTDNAGNRQWITDGVNGRLAAAGDVQGFTRALLELAANPEQAAKMGQTGRQIVEERANWDKNIHLLLDMYAQLKMAYA